MKNLWDEREAEAYITKYEAQGLPGDQALRLYTNHLLGNEPKLVIHGGGNTSLKNTVKDIFNNNIDGLWVKGSGQDMSTITPAGMCQLDLTSLLRLRELDAIEDEDMVNQQKKAMMDCQSPNPSVETLLHAFIPKRFVDHTHSSAILSLTDQSDGAQICRRIFGDRVGIVPYVRPGFQLAKLCAEQFEKDPNVEGLILLKHGIFTFGDTAKEAYSRMIELVTVAEEALASQKPSSVPLVAPQAISESDRAKIVSWLRGILQKDQDESAKHWILETRTTDKTLAWAGHPDIKILSQKGVVTPDHLLWTKCWPVVLPHPGNFVKDSYRETIESEIDAFRKSYQSWFSRHNASLEKKKIPLDPEPRIILVPGIGVIGVGDTAKRATICADIYETSIDTILNAERLGAFQSINDHETFDFEYWSLEQAKLGKKKPLALAGRVVVITGGAGAIGAATARSFRDLGAEVVVLDLNQDVVQKVAEEIGVVGYVCNVTSGKDVEKTFEQICLRFGGVDIVVSNAGGARSGKVGDLGIEELKQEFDLNFFSHQLVSQSALKIFRRQKIGGQILYNISKQAVNPGPDFGAYGLPKAATLFLMRQYAVDHSSEGVRVNGVNADRIRSGLLTGEMISERSSARGVSEDQYMKGNLLGKEVRPEDVARAFVHLAQSERTSGCVLTVDGGNIAAAMR